MPDAWIVCAFLFGAGVALFQAVLYPIIAPADLPRVEAVAGMIVAILGSFGLHKTVKSFQR